MLRIRAEICIFGMIILCFVDLKVDVNVAEVLAVFKVQGSRYRFVQLRGDVHFNGHP